MTPETNRVETVQCDWISTGDKVRTIVVLEHPRPWLRLTNSESEISPTSKARYQTVVGPESGPWIFFFFLANGLSISHHYRFRRYSFEIQLSQGVKIADQSLVVLGPHTWWETSDGGMPRIILKRRISWDWTVRRTKEDDVYFFNRAKHKPTAYLWRDPTTINKRPLLLEPLPLRWRLAQHDAKLLYHHIGQLGCQIEPQEIVKQFVFEHVLYLKARATVNSETFLGSISWRISSSRRIICLTNRRCHRDGDWESPKYTAENDR
jgi:hypothetical protein